MGGHLKFGTVDIILDDGGHTNLDQIITVVKSIPNIRDGGMLVTEDTHASYKLDYNSSFKHSFINFTKNLIDDLNSNINFDFDKNFKNFSLKKFVYSYQFYESIVVMNIDRKRTFKNYIVKNSGKNHGVEDLFFEGNEINIKSIKKFLKKIPFIRLNKFTNYLKNKINSKKISRYFE